MVRDHALNELIQVVRRRRTQIDMFKGVAIISVAGASLLLLLGWLAYKYRANAGMLISLRILALAAIVAAVYFFIVRPLRRRPTDRQLARLIEERHPGTADRFVSAIEFGDHANTHSESISKRLSEDADRHAGQVQVDEIVPKKRAWQYGGVAAAAMMFFIGALIFGPREINSGLLKHILGPVASAATDEKNALTIGVKPGNARVPKNSDQRLLATLNNFESETVTLFWRKLGGGDSQWVGHVMEPAKSKNDYHHFIFNIQDSIEYYVEANEVKSETFKLDVADLPYVKQIDLNISFPGYTGLPPKEIENGGEIVALQGSVARITAKLTAKAKAARIVLRDGTKIEMTASGENDFVGNLTVTKETSYHIEMVSVDGDVYNGSNEYDIILLGDQPPTVSFEKPGRDTRATSVEEIFTQAKAEDDYGVVALDMYFSVNGGEEKKVDLQQLSKIARERSGNHTFFMEEYGLQPGDFISYYAKARDAHSEASSDIYFIEVKPFERNFKQAQQPPGGGGQGEQQNALTKRQKELIAATFRIQREEPTYDETTKAENYSAVALGQEKLRDDANQLINRIKSRMGAQLDGQEEFVKLVEHLVQAVKEMETAIPELKNKKAKDALPPEQRSLQQLLRADAIFRDIQVAMSESSEGSGQQRAEELADLFELELDKMKNQYETVQREKQQQNQQADDETKRKLEELARRQQKELEEQQRRAQQQGQQRQSGGGGGGRQQQQLIEETRKAARELEKLSRERRDQRLAEMSRQLEQAANEMQKAQSAGQNNNETERMAQNLRALQRLEDAQRQLQQMKRNGAGQSAQELRQRAANAAARQKEIANEVESMARQGQPNDQNAQNARQNLNNKKEELANEVNNLERDIDQAARSMGQEQGRAGDQMREAANSLRRNRVADRIRANKQLVQNNWMEAARQGERVIQQNLEEVAGQLQEAEQNAKQKGAGGDQTEENLDRTRQLANNIENLQQRLAERGQRNGQNQQGRNNQNNQQQNGQPNEQQQNGQPNGQGKDQNGKPQNSQQGDQGQQPGKQSQQQGKQSQQGKNGQQPSGQQPGNQKSGNQQASGQQPGGQQKGRGESQGQGQQPGGQQPSQGQGQGQGQQPGGQQPGGQQAGSQSNGQANGGGPSNSPQNQQPGGPMNGGGPPMGGNRQQQLNAEIAQRLREAEDLRRGLGKDRDLARGLDQAIQNLRNLASQANEGRFRDDTQTAALLKTQVVDPLREVEVELSRRLQAKLGRNNLRLSDQGEAPERYRKLVDEYYKRLSNRSTGPEKEKEK